MMWLEYTKAPLSLLTFNSYILRIRRIFETLKLCGEDNELKDGNKLCYYVKVSDQY